MTRAQHSRRTAPASLDSQSRGRCNPHRRHARSRRFSSVDKSRDLPVAYCNAACSPDSGRKQASTNELTMLRAFAHAGVLAAAQLVRAGRGPDDREVEDWLAAMFAMLKPLGREGKLISGSFVRLLEGGADLDAFLCAAGINRKLGPTVECRVPGWTGFPGGDDDVDVLCELLEPWRRLEPVTASEGDPRNETRDGEERRGDDR